MSELAVIFTFVLLIVGGWYALEAWKVKHGYPISDDEGRLITGKGRPEDAEEIRRLNSENAELRQRLDKIGDRVATLERIATDKPSRLAAEIDALAQLSDERKSRDESVS